MTTSPGWPPDEPTEQLLRAALEMRAAQVDVGADALSTIRARTANRAWWHRFRGGAMPLAFTTGAATAVAATITAVIFTAGSCAPPANNGPSTPAGASSGPASSTPTTAGTKTSPPAAVTANVPVYFTGNVNGIPMLYREYHQLAVGDGSKANKTKAAIVTMLDGRNAYDHDYISSWPAAAGVRSVQISGDTVTVDLSGASVNAYDPPTEKAALQQLIYTATAVSGLSGVRLLLDGKPVDKLWNLLPTSGVLHRGSAVEYQAPIWVIDPQQNAVVGSNVTVNVAGIVFEASMRVRIRNASNAVVYDQHVQLTAGPPAVGTATITVPGLSPGTYTIEGYFLSAKDGSELGVDSHTFTVK